MKKIVLFFSFLVLVCNIKAQTVDYELIGFLDSQDEVTSNLGFMPTTDLELRVRLKNNGPNVPAMTDTVRFDIFCYETKVSQISVLGRDLQNVLSGDSCVIETPAPLYSAAIMDEYNMTAFPICYEVHIIGAATDPNPDNNTACVQINRPLPVEEFSAGEIKVYPNPTSAMCKIEADAWNGELGTFQVEVYDLFGKQLRHLQMSGNAMMLDMSDFSNGMYVLRIIADGQCLKSEKIIKM